MASAPATKWATPWQSGKLFKDYFQAKQAGKSLETLQSIIDDWMATLFDLHPLLETNAFGALLNGTEKDIFVETRLLEEAPATPHTRIEAAVRIRGEEDWRSPEKCFASPPLYAVSRSWNDGGNPAMSAVVSMKILVASETMILVTIELEDGRSAEVALEKFGGAWSVNPQQGEVAELVVTLARSVESLKALGLLKPEGTRLEHQLGHGDDQRCVRLFCGCNQYVNTNIRDFLDLAKSKEEHLARKLSDKIWHYSMPHDSSLWDSGYMRDCFEFQHKLMMLASKRCLILQPECGWVGEHAEKIKVAEDSSLVWGWQRDPVSKKASVGKEIGTRLSAHCVMKATKDAVQHILEAETTRLPSFQLSNLFRREAKTDNQQDEDNASALVKYLDLPRHITPIDLPTRLWNVKNGEVHERETIPSGTLYCAVSYVWKQWPDSNGLTGLEHILNRLKKVASQTGVDWFWVDGKCIHQGKKEDKARELPKMGQYYGGAAFTLVLLPDVTASQKTPTPVPWQIFDAKAHRESNKKMRSQYINCRWLRRIWTMQEAWLARKLVFQTGAGLVRGDYLELLRVSEHMTEKSPVPACLEWMNIGPALVLGAATGDLVVPDDARDTPTLLTRPAGSLLQGNDGTGLQARTASLHRTLRLSVGRRCDPGKPSGKLIGLLGMVDRGDELTEQAVAQAPAAALEGDPEQVFRLAVKMGILGPEIMLCGTTSHQLGSSWLPDLRAGEKGVDLPYTASKVLKSLPVMNIEKDFGVSVKALEAELTSISWKRRITVQSGEKAHKYPCTLTLTNSGHKLRAEIESVKSIRGKTRKVLLLQRPSEKGPFICIGYHQMHYAEARHMIYQRIYGCLLKLALGEQDDIAPFEQKHKDGFSKRIIE